MSKGKCNCQLSRRPIFEPRSLAWECDTCQCLRFSTCFINTSLCTACMYAQEAMEASAGGEASRRPWLSVQQLGQTWLQPSEATPDPQPKLSFLQYEQERYRQQQLRHQDTSREGSEDSYSDEYAAALSTALQAWEAESRSFGRRLGRDARQGFLVLGCKHTGGSWAPAAVRAARQRLDRRLGRVPAAWLEQAQQARGGTAHNLGALQWRLPWALV